MGWPNGVSKSLLVLEAANYNAYGPQREKICLRGLQTIKAQMSLRRLISTIVIRLMESIKSNLATSEISIF